MIGQISALCLIGALLVLVIKRGTPETGLLLTLAVVVIAFLVLIDPIKEILEFLNTLTIYSGIAQTMYVPLYKTLGIALIVRIGSNLCKDAGESALAAAVESAGAVCALLTALPLMQAVLSLLLELVQ